MRSTVSRWRQTLAASAAVAIVGALVPVGVASADGNPATDNMTVNCVATPEVSTATFGGIRAAGIGEVVRVGTTVHFDEGTVYQDVLQRPDGSTYFASYVETIWQAPAGLSLIAGSAQLSIAGAVQTLVPGTQPALTGWVVEEAPLGVTTRFRVYFPGDAAAMLADPTGVGLPSVVIPPGGQDFSLTVAGYVSDVPANMSGAVHDAAECFAAVSTGPSNRTSDRPHVQVGILEPRLELNKSSLSGVNVAAGAIVNYRLALHAPAFDPDTLTPYGDPQGVSVVDTVPTGMTPLGAGNVPLADGAANAAGGVWNATARTLTFTRTNVAAGTTMNIDYPVQVDHSVGTGTGLTNSASATWKSAAGSYPVRNYGPVADSQTVTTAAPAPTIVKAVDRPVVGINTPLTYTIRVDFPASGSTFYNATVYDTLPTGMGFDNNATVTCVSGCPETATFITPYTSAANGWTRFGWYFGNLPAGPARTFEITYQAHINQNYPNGTPVPLETEFENNAQIRMNSVDRLGSVIPQAAAPPSHDVIETSRVSVRYSRPILNMTKTVNLSEPADPVSGQAVQYTVRVTNTGGLAAGSFTFDDNCSSSCNFVSFNSGASSAGTMLNWMGGSGAGFAYSGSLEPGDGVDFVYTVVPNSRWFEDSTHTLDNRAQINSIYDPFGSYYPERPVARISRSFLIPNVAADKEIVSVNGVPYTGQAISTVGSEITYRVTLTNSGTGTALITSLADTVPGAFELLSTSANVVGTQPSPGGVIDFSSVDPVWNLAPNGGQAVYEYTVSTNGTGAGSRTNTVALTYSDLTGRTSVDGREFESNDNATATLQAPILRVQKSPDASANQYILDGTSSSFTVRVANESTTVGVTNVLVDDVMPASLFAGAFDATSQLAWSGSGTPGTVSAAPGWSPSNPQFIIDELEAGQAVTITIPVTHDGTDPAPGAEVLTNTATASAVGAATVSDTGALIWESATPAISIAKTPDAESGALIQQGGTGQFAIEVRNNSHLAVAAPLVVDDPMPPSLSFAGPLVGPGGTGANWFISGGGAIGTLTEAPGSTSTHPIFTLSALQPGQTLRIVLAVTQDNTVPPDLDMENTATVTTAGSSVSDSGTLTLSPNIGPPTMSKSVTPTFGAPNTPVVFTVTAVFDPLGAPTYDTTVIDTMPDGLVFDSYGAVTCTDGCPLVSEFAGVSLPAISNPDGSTTLGWFFGDRPVSAGPTTVTMQINAHIGTSFSGTGTPIAGTQVADGVPGGDPLTNLVRSYISLSNDVSGMLTAIPPTPNSFYDLRSATRTASVDVRTPAVAIQKSSDESDGELDVDEAVQYTVRVTNTGTAPAYDIHVEDDMAGGKLDNVDTNPAASPLPAGVSVTDGWTPADPTTRWLIAGPLAPGASVDIVYTGTTLPSSRLTPASTSFAGDYAEIRNTARVKEFHAAPTGGIGDFLFTSTVNSVHRLKVYTPLPRATIGPCWTPSSFGPGGTFNMRARIDNYYGWAGSSNAWSIFPTTTAGTLYNSVYTVTLPAQFTFIPGSVYATGSAVGDSTFSTWSAYANPTVSPDGRVLTWDLGDIPPSWSWLELQFDLSVSSVPVAGNVTTQFTGEDVTGAVRRGDAASAEYEYRWSSSAGECGTPVPTSYFTKGPDSAQVLLGNTHTFFMSLTHNLGRISENPVIVDTLPAGLEYTPGTASVVAPIPYTESVVPGPGGTTLITWTFTGSTSDPISISMPVGTGAGTPLNTALTNTATATDVGGFNSTDTGTVVVKNPVAPTVEKAVTPGRVVHGDSLTYTVEVTIPANQEYFDLIAVDRMNFAYGPTGTQLTFGGYISAACISGCSPGGPDDIVPQTLTPNGWYIGMLLGDITPDVEPRVIRLVYSASTLPTSDASVEPFLAAGAFGMVEGTNGNVVTVADSTDITSPGAITYDPTNSNWFTTYSSAGAANVRDSAMAEVQIVEPHVTVDKECSPIGSTDNPGTQGTDLQETLPGVPNHACTLTVRNDSQAPAYDVMLRDTPSTTSDVFDQWGNHMGNQSVTALEVLSYAPFSPTTPYSAGLGYFEWAAGDLDPGESRTFTYLGRLSATPFALQGWYALNVNLAELSNGWLNNPSDTVRMGNGGAKFQFRMTAPDLEITKLSKVELDRLVADRPDRDLTPFLSSWFNYYEWEHQFSSSEAVDWVLGISGSQISGLNSIEVTDYLPRGYHYKPGSAKLVEIASTPTGSVRTEYPIEPSVMMFPGFVCDPNGMNTFGDQVVWTLSKAGASPANRPWHGSYATSADPTANGYDPSFGSFGKWEKLYRIEFTSEPGPEVGHCINWSYSNSVNYKNIARVQGMLANGGMLMDFFEDTLQVFPTRLYLTKGRQEVSDSLEASGCGTAMAFQTQALDEATLSATCPGLDRSLFGESLAFTGTSGEPYEPGDTIPYAIQVGGRDLNTVASFDVADTLPYGLEYVPGSGRLVIRTGATGPEVELPWEPVVTDVPDAACLEHFETHQGDGDRMVWSFQSGAGGPSGALWTPDHRGNGDILEAAMDPANLYYWGIDAHVELRYETTVTTPCIEVPIYFQQYRNDVVMENLTFADGFVETSPDLNGKWGSFGPNYFYVFDFITFEKTPDGGFSADDTTTGFDITVKNYAPTEFGGQFIDELGTDLYHLNDPVITDTFSTAGGSHYVPGTATATDQDGNSVVLTEVSVTVNGDETTVVWALPNMPGSDTATFSEFDPDGYYTDPTVWTIHVPIVVPYGEFDGMELFNTASLSSSTWDWVRTDDADITIINPSPAPDPAKHAEPAAATINDPVTYSVDVTIPERTVYFDLAYRDLVPDGIEFLGHAGVSCVDSLGDDCLSPGMVTTMPSVANADGTTTLEWWMGDLVGNTLERTFTFRYQGRVNGSFTSGDEVTSDDVLVNSVRGYSNETNKLDAAPTAIDPSAFDFASAELNHELPILEPEVTVSKSILDPTTPRGAFDSITYTLTVQNTGDGTAYDVRIVDDPPAYLENIVPLALTGAEVDGWTIDDPHMEWYFGAMNPGESYTLQYTASIVGNIADFGLLTVDNVARASEYRGRDFVEAGNRSYVGAEVTGSVPLVGPQIHVEKYSDAACSTENVLVNVGDQVPFCVVVTNPGTGPMYFVDLKDLLPMGWTYVAGSATALGSPEPVVLSGAGGAQLLVWDLGTVSEVGAPIVMRYLASPSVSTAHSVSNHAYVEGRNALGVRLPVTATAYRDDDSAGASLFDAALEIKKTPDFQYLPYVPGGGPLSWAIEVSNPSPATHRNVIITDTMPAGIVYTPGAATSSDPGFSEVSVVPNAGGTTTITWKFDALPPGESYQIDVNTPIPPGFTELTSFLNDVSATSDQIGDLVANQARVVIYGPNAIGDKAFIDSNGDGIQQSGEGPLAGVTVNLLDSSGAVIRTMLTDSTGLYLFDALVPGTYEVQFVLPAGYEFTTRGAGSDDELDSDADPITGRTGPITVVSLDDQFGWDAGFVQRGSIGNFVWDDRNADGVQSAGEPGTAGATVTLRDPSGAVVATVVTGADGSYLFSNLLPGSYSISIVPPTGAWHFAPQSAGSDPTLDSEVNGLGVGALFTLLSGQTDTTRDVGMYQPVDLKIEKSTPVQVVELDQVVEWNIEVQNTTDRTAFAPTHVIDNLPSFLSYVGYSSDQWVCDANGQVVDCVRSDDIAPGDVSTLTLRTRVVSVTDSLVNFAQVESPLDNDPSNNEDDAKVEVLSVTEVPDTKPTTTTTTSITTTSITTTTSVPAPPSGSLPVTGASALVMVLLAGGCIATGLVVLPRRRRRVVEAGE